MKSPKCFVAPIPVAATIIPSPDPLDESVGLVIRLPENPSSLRTLDLTPWLGQGIDAWVWACAGPLRVFLSSQECTTATVASYWRNGLRQFFTFLIAQTEPSEPIQLTPRHLRRYLGWLNEQGWAYGTQRKIYHDTKSVLSSLVRRQIVPDLPGLFPANPFPNANRHSKGATPLSSGERLRLAQALRDDLVAIHQGGFDGIDSAALVVYLLAVAIRTGANTTPLLEAARDCLHPHPFMPGMMRLELFKRRGNATKILQLRYSKESDLSLSVPLDGVALLRKAMALSEPLLTEAKLEHRDRIWLYQITKGGRAAGRVSALTHTTLGAGIASLIKRHNLRADNGEQLQITLSRLRKTLEHRLFDLSGGDLIATAALMGHTPTVADSHYLACTQQMRENATFVGEALPNIYAQGQTGAGAPALIPLLPDPSPTGRCKDPYQGDRAPKNGQPCDDFFACFACTSYAIVGSPEDLHRLFSFYFFLERELHHAKSEDWRGQFRHTINLIDRFTADKFDPAVVATARERARCTPLTFWASYALSEELIHG